MAGKCGGEFVHNAFAQRDIGVFAQLLQVREHQPATNRPRHAVAACQLCGAQVQVAIHVHLLFNG